MKNEEENRTEQASRSALDQNQQALPDHITTALADARKKAMLTAESEQPPKPTAKIYAFDRPKLVWSGAIAASVTALALSLALQNPASDIPVEAEYLLTLAELESLDDTEWQLVQDLEFALWLSELGEDALAIEPQG